MSPVFGHLRICFGRGTSIARCRIHRVSLSCPQREVILRWTPAHQETHLERVCRACWMAATRELQRQVLHDAHRPAQATVGSSTMDTADMDVDTADVNIPQAPPLPQPVQPLQPNQSPEGQQQTHTVPKINSLKYKRVATTSRHCVLNGCENPGRLLVPTTVKEVLLVHYKIYIPLSARICSYVEQMVPTI